MKRFTIMLILVFFSLMTLGAGAAGEVSEGSLEPGDVIKLTGRIKVKGNEPFPMTVLETEEGRDYVLSGEKADLLCRDFQLKMMSIKARVIRLGDGLLPAEIEVLSYEIAGGG